MKSVPLIIESNLHRVFKLHHYNYKAIPLRIIDGDTVKFSIDLGFHVSIIENVRLFGIDAPEIRGPERPDGLKSKDHITKLIESCEQIILETRRDKQGKYGRYIATIWGMIGMHYININDQMVIDGFAKEAQY